MYLSKDDVQRYNQDGFLLVPDLFSAGEVQRMIQEIRGGERIASAEINTSDSLGMKVKLTYWENLIGDIWSAASTCPRVVNNVRILLGEEAAFFHGKVMLKEAHTGGAWEWHQDYGYWYDQGFMYPRMLSVFVALDAATQLNGCLRVLKGSHKLGRLSHGAVGGQTGADPARVAAAEELHETVHCEMTPGSVLFFDSNLLHCSSANDSDFHRHSFIMCYSAWDNPQQTENGFVRREPCPVGADDSI
ncbi:phytanoyl-CoA dioxygenase family protein [Paenibacillus eucommiae]|uniref:Ectoine hydroxylase-related dioxygenase (Phytanoyl-CoA dioxygenase family) n=1 Tax=Paenibacillus eucommiae TaxID=1355755 RepID=A0ABS4J7A7_9BACL|nr:phytanoyl-CoA dioxygenase family protein [Paenibacillus eucommiae]MBP1995737.1 ectoine hydroxylase-related dioxygenase (phytanoyl-CoA dioxygenase family) [Paenibacillus eucommiae]